MKTVGQELIREGVRGIVGIDSILTGNEFFPVIDINVRFTLSTYLSVLPYLLTDRYFLAVYYRVLLTEKTGYDALQQRAVRDGIAFDPDKKEGVFFYNRACMEKGVAGEIGRLFVVMVAKSRSTLAKLQLQMDKLLEGGLV